MAKKPLIELFKKEIEDVTVFLIETGFVDDQNLATRRPGRNGNLALEANYWADAPRMQEKIPYRKLYERLRDSRSYDLKFLDGAFVQFRFEFRGENVLSKGELRFLPSPTLSSFQEDPDLYLNDELFGDVVDERAVTSPLRFDYDDSDGVVQDVLHPISHLTLGQYPHCRIAASTAITPHYFIEFLLRSFYRGRSALPTRGLPKARVRMPETITAGERSLLHIGLPVSN